MHLSVELSDREALLTLAGEVGPSDVTPFRTACTDALETSSADLVIDARGLAHVDDALFTALVLVRSRAKFLRRLIIVVDDAEGATSRGLRRRGMDARIPVCVDVAEASAAIAGIRAARERLTVGELQRRGPVVAATPR